MRPCALLLGALAAVVSAQPPCNLGELLTQGTPLGPPVPLSTSVKQDGQECAFLCMADASCRAFNWAAGGSSCTAPSPGGAAGGGATVDCTASPGGCCVLLTGPAVSSLNASRPASGCGCSFIIRPDPSSLPPLPPPPPPPQQQQQQQQPETGATAAATAAAARRNVLYILVDDLRPDLLPFGPEFMRTPNVAALAAAGTTFTRAYCNIAVCSPSRMSFLSGRYPANTRTWNFLNHIRQADCQATPGFALDKRSAYRTLALANGGAAQCCTFCNTDGPAACAGWNLAPDGSTCTLHSSTDGYGPSPGFTSGIGSGVLTRRGWKTLPQHFTESGFLTLSSGKIYHTEEGGEGPAPWDAANSGMPPLQDPIAWSRSNTSMANVNALAPMRPCSRAESPPAADSACSVDATLEGDVPPGVFRLCDRIIADDAVAKLQLAADNLRATGQPFFMAVGFRKPHLPFRHPAAYDPLYPAPPNITLAAHKTLDPSVPPIAFHQTSLAESPYSALPDLQAGTLRRDYYASISWMDHNLGRVLAELEALGLANDTAVVFHADHGWSLGEYGEWEKFTNWEFGTRVPLIISAPWLRRVRDGAEGGGAEGLATTDTIAELVDVYPTLAELAGIPVPASYGLDGASLVPALLGQAADSDSAVGAAEGGGAAAATAMATTATATTAATATVTRRKGVGGGAVGQYALSVYPRCPANLKNASDYWANNDCLLVERSAFPFMGVSIRTDLWRYTEWLPWNGTALVPLFGAAPVGVELYSHAGDDGTTFDGPFEVINLAGVPAYAAEQAQLAAQLRSVYPPPSEG